MELAVTLAMAPVIALVMYIYHRDRHNREPLYLLIKLFLSGSLSAIPVYFIEKLLSYFNIFHGFPSALYTAFIVAGAVEEYFKRLVVIKIAYNNKSYDEKLDGIVYCTFSALGFAAVENLIYVIGSINNSFYIGITRGLFSVPSHMLFGITMGYYLSLAKYSKSEKSRVFYYRKSYLIPVLLHGIFDYILISHLINYLVIFILFLVYLWKNSLDKLDEFAEDSKQIKN